MTGSLLGTVTLLSLVCTKEALSRFFSSSKSCPGLDRRPRPKALGIRKNQVLKLLSSAAYKHTDYSNAWVLFPSILPSTELGSDVLTEDKPRELKR